MHRIAIIALTLIAAMLAGCGASGSAESAGAVAPDQAAMPEEPAAVENQAPAEEEAAGGDTDAVVGGDAAAPVPDLAAAPGDRIVRQGTMRLEIEEGGFDRAFTRVVDAAGRLGGTVLTSNASSDDEGLTSGTVTVRVPADDYDALLTAISGIGEVRERSITSEDVTAEFVDLEARLRHNEAQERFYLSLLDRAESVEDAIAVQQQVQTIQQTIEQLRGRISFLEERTSFSRLTVELFESGAAFQQAGAQPTFAHYWEVSRNALVNVLGTALVIATVLLPFVVVGLVIFVIVRRAGAAGRRPGPTAPAPEA